MDIKVLKKMVQDALDALDEYERTGSSNNGVFSKIRAAGDICIDNRDLHPFLKKELDLTIQYAFKSAAFSLSQLSSLSGMKDNHGVRNLLNQMNSAYTALIEKEVNSPREQVVNDNVPQNTTKVFIVHGHDDLMKVEMARFIDNAGLEAIILHEQPSGSKTIIEKIESFGDVGFAVILYTPCDVGAKNTDDPNLLDRARQNVVFEHGYFIGRLGRSRVAALVKGSIETPNDISGVVYTPVDPMGAWKMTLFNELQNAGYNVDTRALR
ncbi:TIR domain-containing protein [Vibrio sinaloensis]|uniref:TIR domain-containing protein n=1 Tax=Photobacterium sp. (strain ATCC 43367) TaxID=379097 RepID=UPI00068C4DD7|nr:nucleotide-binding protein [Vibrio sinaloensis]